MSLSNFKYLEEGFWWSEFRLRVHTWTTSEFEDKQYEHFGISGPIFKAGKVMKSWEDTPTQKLKDLKSLGVENEL